MGKRIVSVVAGVIVAMIVIGIIEGIGFHFYPPPADADFTNSEVIKQIMASKPLSAFILLLAGYALGSFAGGITTSLISGRKEANLALITGISVTMGGLVNLYLVPHPLWFSIISTLVYVPFAYLGYRVLRTPEIAEKSL